MIKLLRFDGYWLVADIDEIPETEFGDPDCTLNAPCEVTEDGLVPFPPFTDEKQLAVRSANISLIAEPDATTLALYYALIKPDPE